jgi:hypothetical protein
MVGEVVMYRDISKFSVPSSRLIKCPDFFCPRLRNQCTYFNIARNLTQKIANN